MNPSLLIETLQNVIRNKCSNSESKIKKKSIRSNEEIIMDLKTPTKARTRFSFFLFEFKYEVNIFLYFAIADVLFVTFYHDVRSMLS